jgi:hypothetical protein
MTIILKLKTSLQLGIIAKQQLFFFLTTAAKQAP